MWISNIEFHLRSPLLHAYDPSKRTKLHDVETWMKGRLPRVIHASAPLLSWPNNEWSKPYTARRHRRPVDFLLQLLGLQFLVNSDASRLDRCSSQEMGGGTKHLMSLVPLGRFEGIGILKGFVSSSACFSFHWRPTADHFALQYCRASSFLLSIYFHHESFPSLGIL